MATQNNEDLRLKLAEFAAAWQAQHNALDRELQQRAPLPAEDTCGTSFLALSLSPLPLSQTIGHAAMHSGAPKVMDVKNRELTKRGVRLSFVLLRVVRQGFASGENSRVPQRNGKPSREPLTFKHADHHVRVHQFETLGMSMRGARTPDYVVLSPGMTLGMSVWTSTSDTKDSIHAAFKHQTADIKPMDLFVVELALKGSSRDNPATSDLARESKLSLRGLRQLPGLTPASIFQVPARLASPSVALAETLRVHFAAATHLSDAAALAARGPLDAGLRDEDLGTLAQPLSEEGLNQKLIAQNLAKTTYFLHVLPRAGVIESDADDVLRFYGDASEMARTTGLTTGAMPLLYDEAQFPSREWAVKLFNLALSAGALELLIAVNLGADASLLSATADAAPVIAYARLRQSRFVELLLSKDAVLPKVPDEIAEVFRTGKRGAALRHMIAVRMAEGADKPEEGDGEEEEDAPPSGDTLMVIDTRVEQNSKTIDPNTTTESEGATPQRLLGCVMPSDNPTWARGHMLYLFVGGRLVFYMVAPIEVAGMRAIAKVSARNLTALALPGAEEEEEEEAPPPPKAVKAAAASSSSKKEASKRKRKDDTDDEE
jgi:hypothetical protein